MKQWLYAPLFLPAILLAPRDLAQMGSPPAPSPTIKFDVTSFKPCQSISGNRNTELPPDGDFIARHCQSVHALIDFAFADLGTHQLKNQPDWVDTEGFEFLAKVSPEDVSAWHQTSLGTKKLMLRAVLAESLKMRTHVEKQSRPIYALVVAKDGPKMAEHKPGPNDPPSGPIARADVHWVGPDDAVFTNTTMAELVSSLSARLDRSVIDQTGLPAGYDFHVKPLPGAHYSARTTGVEDTDFGAILDGIKSLGLRLEPAKADTSVIVIDYIERPVAN